MNAREKGYYYDAIADLIETVNHRCEDAKSQAECYEGEDDWSKSQREMYYARANAYAVLVDRLEKM